jgi:hypothetical protein
MSMGTIIRNGLVEPKEMEELKHTYTCSCGDEFSIYLHKAHPENVDQLVDWLKGILDAEHSRKRSVHDNSYHCPF